MGEPASRTIGALLTIGLAFHLVYIAAVFDCYFTVIVYLQLMSVASTLTGTMAWDVTESGRSWHASLWRASAGRGEAPCLDCGYIYVFLHHV
jgi:hypothetical protein